MILMRAQNSPRYRFGAWLVAAATRLHRHKLATALANKLERIACGNEGGSVCIDMRHQRRLQPFAGMRSLPSRKKHIGALPDCLF